MQYSLGPENPRFVLLFVEQTHKMVWYAYALAFANTLKIYLLAHVVHVGHLDVVEEALGDCGAAATQKTYRARAQNHISPSDRELCWAAILQSFLLGQSLRSSTPQKRVRCPPQPKMEKVKICVQGNLGKGL